jgi:transcriptional regulator with XRE-family HTH domain
MANATEYRCLTPQEIGTAVTMFRHAAGMKQITLAMEAGVTERTVQRIERGEKVNDDSLRAIARVFRMDENSFFGPRDVLSEEEAIAHTLNKLEGLMVIEAHRFATLKDAEAVLGTHGMLMQDRDVSDDAAEDVANFRDLLREWNDAYSCLDSNVEKLRASRSVLDAAKKLEARGYVIRYGVYNTTDDFQLVGISIARKADDDLCAVKQLVVPNRFTEMAHELHPWLKHDHTI